MIVSRLEILMDFNGFKEILKNKVRVIGKNV